MPLDKEQLRQYWIHDLKWGWGRQSRVIFEYLFAAGQAGSGGVVLDAGAGNQRYKPFFRDALYLAQEHQAGVDMKRLRDYQILCDVKKIPLKDNCVDMILSTVAIEHIRYPEQFYREAFRVLKPGGSLWVQGPFVYNEHEIPYDFQRPTRYGMIRWYEDCGFERVEIQPSSSSTEAIGHFVPFALREDVRRLGGIGRLVGSAAIAIASLMTGVLVKLFDRGPFPDTTLPIGWISKGWKPGTHRPDQASSMPPLEFLKASRMDDPRAVLQDGVLYWRE